MLRYMKMIYYVFVLNGLKLAIHAEIIRNLPDITGGLYSAEVTAVIASMSLPAVALTSLARPVSDRNADGSALFTETTISTMMRATHIIEVSDGMMMGYLLAEIGTLLEISIVADS